MTHGYLSNEYAGTEPLTPAESRARTITPSLSVIETVAEVTNRDPIELPPLQHYVDADALDSLFEPVDNTNTDVQLRFTYDGVDIVVEGSPDPEIRVIP